MGTALPFPYIYEPIQQYGWYAGIMSLWLFAAVNSTLNCACVSIDLVFTQKHYNNYGYYLHFAALTEGPAFKSDLLIPLFPQDMHSYHNLFYMTKHISAAQMLPRPPQYTLPPLHSSVIQLPFSTCGCRSISYSLTTSQCCQMGDCKLWRCTCVYVSVCVCMGRCVYP